MSVTPRGRSQESGNHILPYFLLRAPARHVTSRRACRDGAKQLQSFARQIPRMRLLAFFPLSLSSTFGKVSQTPMILLEMIRRG